VFLTSVNYRGIRLSANFQKIVTTLVLLIFVVIAGMSGSRGASANLHPLFHADPWISVLLTLQIVPYFLTGFESIPKYAEEASPGFGGRNYMAAIALTLGVGVVFYASCIASVAYVVPWQGLLGKRFATAIAFEQALHARWPVDLILTMAMFGLFQCFNGNFAASTRMLFAFGRNGSMPVSLARIHPRFQTPCNAVLAIGAGSLIALFFGDAILVPVTEVGSGASAFGWLAACTSFLIVVTRAGTREKPSARLLSITLFGALASLVFVLMKFLPIVPGHFSRWEWISLAFWLCLGAVLHRRRHLAGPV
jgi:basic amino acid/polyamine antiporter, APA family